MCITPIKDEVALFQHPHASLFLSIGISALHPSRTSGWLIADSYKFRVFRAPSRNSRFKIPSLAPGNWHLTPGIWHFAFPYTSYLSPPSYLWFKSPT